MIICQLKNVLITYDMSSCHEYVNINWFYIFYLSGEYTGCVSALGQDLGGSLAGAGSTLHLQSHLENHDQLQSYQPYHLHQQQQQHYSAMAGDFSNYGPIYGSAAAYSNYVKCRTNPYPRPSTPPHTTATMPLYYPGKRSFQEKVLSIFVANFGS